MKVLNKVKSIIFRKNFQSAVLSSDNINVSGIKNIFNKDIADFYMINPWLFKGVSLISKKISAVDWELYRKLSNGELEKIEDHPFLTLFNSWDPILNNGVDSRFVKSALEELTGESILLIEKDKIGKPLYLYHILKSQIEQYPQESNEYRYKIRVGKELWSIPQEDILISKNPNPLDPYGSGLAPVSVLSDEIRIDEAASKIVASHLENGGIPPYIIGIDADEETAKKIKEKWIADYSKSFKNRGIPLFTGATNINVVKLMESLKDIGATELRKEQYEAIRKVFGIPPELMGDVQNSNRATIEEAEAILVMTELTPRLEREEKFWNNKIIKVFYGEDLIFKFKSPLPTNNEFKFKVMSAAPKSCFSLNDWRELAGSPRLDSLEGKYSILMNEIIVDESELLENKSLSHRAINFKKKDKNKVEKILDEIDIEDMYMDVVNIYEILIFALGTETLLEINTSIAFDKSNKRIIEYLENNIRNTQKNISESLKLRIEKAIQQGYRNGNNTKEIRKSIEKVFENKMKNYEIERIVRTETNTAQNFSDFTAYEQSGVVEYLMWMCSHMHSRDHHISMDGQIVKLGEEFISPLGNTTLYPCGFGIAEEDVNCLCYVSSAESKTYRLTDTKKLEFIKKKNRKRKEYEKLFKEAYINMFKNLENKVLRKFDEIGGVN